MRDELAQLVAAAIAALDPRAALADSYGTALNALPLLSDLRGCHFLRADGVYLEVRWDENESAPDVLTSVPVAALVVGTERYPWLRELLPVRPPNAVDCPTCNGVGKIFAGDGGDGFLCPRCDALGWAVLDIIKG